MNNGRWTTHTGLMSQVNHVAVAGSVRIVRQVAQKALSGAGKLLRAHAHVFLADQQRAHHQLRRAVQVFQRYLQATTIITIIIIIIIIITINIH